MLLKNNTQAKTRLFPAYFQNHFCTPSSFDKSQLFRQIDSAARSNLKKSSF